MRSYQPFAVLLFTTPFFVTFVGARASAEPTAADKSLATQLFKEGRALVDQGKVAEGCRKLEESQRLDPGGGTLLNVALCHEKEGRTATAWAEFTEALGLAKKDDRPQRIELAQTHIVALEPTLSRLVIQVPEGSDFPELEIKRDGGVIRRAAWGTLRRSSSAKPTRWRSCSCSGCYSSPMQKTAICCRIAATGCI